MSRPTRRDVIRGLEDLKKRRTAEQTPTVDVTVEWREVAPDARPEGYEYDPDSGILYYDAWAAQRDCLDALDDEVDIVAMLGGYGSGKTVTGARWTLANALAHPGGSFLAMGQSFSKARDSTFRALFEQLPGERTAVRTGSFNGPERSPIVADYNRADHRLTLTNDTVIVLGSADRWNRLAGTEFGGIWLDEPSHYECDLHDLLEMLGSRLRGAKTDGPKTQFWTLTGNGYNDAWEILEQRRDKTGDPIGLAIEVIRASTLENPYLDDGDLARFERQYADTDREAQALYGGFAATKGRVYSDFDRETHVIPHSEARERAVDGWRVYGYDAGWNDPMVLLEIGKTAYNQLVVLDLFYETERHVEDAITWLTDGAKPTGTIYCEHEPAHLEKLQSAGYPAENANKDRDDGIAEVRKRLEADDTLTIPVEGRYITSPTFSVNYVAADGSEYGDDTASTDEPVVGLLVSDRCGPLIQEFLNYKAEHVGKPGADDHCLDALRYALMGIASR